MFKFNFSPERITAIRVAVAIAITNYFTYNLDLNSYWILITIVFVAQPSIGATLSRSKHRALSTMMGVIVGVFFVIVLHHILWLYALVGAISLFLGVLFLIRRYDVFVFFLTVIIILAFGYNAADVWHFAILRFIDTIFGLAVIFIFSLVFFPISAVQFLRRDFLKTMIILKDLTQLSLAELGKSDPTAHARIGRMRNRLYALQQLSERHYIDLLSETGGNSERRLTSHGIIAQSERVRSTLRTLNVLQPDKQSVLEPLTATMNELCEVSQKIFDSMLAALRGEQQWQDCGIESFADTKIMQTLAKESTPEAIYLYQRLDTFIYDLTHLYQSVQRFSQLQKKHLGVEISYFSKPK